MTVPYPGESIGTPDAWSSDAAGWNLYQSIWWRGGAYGAAPSATLSAGVEWRAWAYHYGGTYLEAADDSTPLDVSWVLEVLSGSGTVEVYDFDDAAFAEDNTHGGHTFLGTLTITGAGTYLMPTSSFTNATLRTSGSTGGAMEVRLVCTAGSIDAQQVKLRAWPVGGPLGDWSAPYDQAPTSAPLSFLQQGIGGGGGTYASQADFRAALSSLAVTSATTPEGDDQINGATMSAVHNIPAGTTQVSGGAGLDYFRLQTGDYLPPGTEGVDWVRAPEEVAEDYLRLVDAPDDGTIAWTQPVASAINSATVTNTSGEGYWSEGSAHLSIQPVDEALPVGTDVYALLGSGSPIQSYPGHGVASVTQFIEDASMPSGLYAGQLYMLLMWHDGHFADVDMPARDADVEGGGTSVALQRGRLVSGVLDPLAAQWQPSPYRYWVPGPATAAVPMRLMQRGDGLGMGSGRVYGLGTRQSSGRVYGPY